MALLSEIQVQCIRIVFLKGQLMPDEFSPQLLKSLELLDNNQIKEAEAILKTYAKESLERDGEGTIPYSKTLADLSTFYIHIGDSENAISHLMAASNLNNKDRAHQKLRITYQLNLGELFQIMKKILMC